MHTPLPVFHIHFHFKSLALVRNFPFGWRRESEFKAKRRRNGKKLSISQKRGKCWKNFRFSQEKLTLPAAPALSKTFHWTQDLSSDGVSVQQDEERRTFLTVFTYIFRIFSLLWSRIFLSIKISTLKGNSSGKCFWKQWKASFCLYFSCRGFQLSGKQKRDSMLLMSMVRQWVVGDNFLKKCTRKNFLSLFRKNTFFFLEGWGGVNGGEVFQWVNATQ